MNILICVSEYPPYSSGAGNVAYYIVTQFIQLGHNCTVCSPIVSDIKICNEKISKNIFHYRGLYILYGILYFWFNVWRYILKNSHKYDIIWCHNINPITFPIEKIEKKAMLTFHSSYYGFANKSNHKSFFSIYYKIMSKLEKINLNKENKLLVFSGVSTQTCDELEVIGINKNRIKYIPNGVDINKFKPNNSKNEIRLKYNIPNMNIVFLSIGRLTAPKQPMKTIEIFSKIQIAVNNISLIIAGSGELLNDMKDYVKINKLKNIYFLGFINHNDTPDLYSCSDYFIISSKYEGQPLTLLEAMASGLPCIVSNIPNLDIVTKANCGIMVDFNDENAAKQIIEYINGNLPIEHSQNARKYAENNLSWRIIAEKYLKEFLGK